MRRVLLLAVLVVAPVACGDDESADPGCEVWVDFLASEDAETASDPEAAAKARDVADATEDQEVRSMATALAARLEDGTDLGNTMTGLGEACGL